MVSGMLAQPPSATELLHVWEAGQALSSVQRALALLMMALPNMSHQAAAEMSIGRRDAQLLSLREQLFGPDIVALARCPGCQERFELSLNAEDIRVEQPRDGLFDVHMDGYAVRARAANSLDVMDAESVSDATVQERVMIAGCTIEARHGDRVVPAHELPDAVVEAIAERMSEADPQADVNVALQCPVCGHEWNAMFDVTAFLWREIDVWAKRLLDEVHALAYAYGWSEADILAMSAPRRRRYLSMIEQSR
jgi:hypothetical protein